MPFTIVFIVAGVLILSFVWYRGTQKPTHAGGIVYKKEKGRILFLVVTSAANKNKWVLPKGRIEENETPAFAAVREVMEEAGVHAKPLKKAGTVKFYKKGRRTVIVYFFMEFVHFYDTSTENRRLAWVGKEEAVKRLGFTNARNIFSKI